MMYDVIAFGSATVDIFVDTYNRRKLTKEQKAMNYKHLISYPIGDKILIQDLNISIGGGGTNVAVTFKRFGLNTGYAGCLGEDYYSTIIQDFLDREGIKFLGHHHAERTGTSIILDSIEHDRTILTYKGANNHLCFAKLPKVELMSRLYYFSSLLDESFESQKKLLEFAKKNKIKVAFNPSSYEVRTGLKGLSRVLSNTNYLILNKEEAQELTGLTGKHEKELLLRIYEHLNKDERIVVITDGPRGAYSYDGKQFLKISVPDVKVIETTGAGDAFASAFVSSLLQGYSVENSLRLGAANAESVITHLGAKEIILTLDEALKSSKLKNYMIHPI